jgi:hypothetical protein
MGAVKVWFAGMRDTILGMRYQVTEICDFVTVVAHVHKVVIVPEKTPEEKGGNEPSEDKNCVKINAC